MSRLLVLEDEDILRETLVDIFEEEGGYQVDGACGPEQAIELGAKKAYDLMVTDIRMAGFTDGIGAAAHIKRKYLPNLLVIVITGYADTEAPGRAMEVEVDLYIYKNDLQRVQDLLVKVACLLKQREKTKKGIFRQFFAPLLEKPLQMLKAREQSKLKHAEEVLAAQRLKTYKLYVVSVTSKTLYRSLARQAWDLLAWVEVRAAKAENLEQMRFLYARYQLVQEFVLKNLNKTGNYSQIPADGATMIQFRDLLDKIEKSKITADELQHAERVRLSSPEERKKNAEWRALYETLWGK